MDTPQITAPPCAPSPVPGDTTPSSGVIHVNSRHAAGFTVIGNHLAQHRGLSLTAIGLAAHIQSLPAGARVGIKHLAERFPESETRIAAALRELEAHGYLHRSRLRLANGRVVTRTISYNQPATTPTPHRPPPATPKPPTPVPTSAPAPTPRTTPPPPPLPQPLHLTPELLHTATTLLAGLRRHAPRLVLSEHDVRALAPGLATWLEREPHPETIRHALTTDLPSPLKHPAGLLRHRITTLLPPPLPAPRTIAPAHRPEATVPPLQNCDGCDRAFRSHQPGPCRDCRIEQLTAA
ncbi:helix-turn-helix domain-containing protein [Streptomyces sp. NPDC015350]|uniref:helix-turn-helix domain-containing protein n=1 Tax=Streptomyces sp. NPDC015350 TaxID=3364955 RepID=UPI0036FDBCD7